MSRRLLVTLVLAVVAVITLMTTACGNTASTSQSQSTKKISVVYIPKNTGNPYFDPIIAGFQKASKELNFEFATVAPPTADATSQIPYVKEQIQRGVNVIAISPNSADALDTVFKEAMDKGIKILVVNSDIPGNESYRNAAVLPVDFNTLGASQVELMGSLINNTGQIAILSATADAPDQNFWIQGMKQALKDPKYQHMDLVKIAYGNDDPQKSTTEAQALLTEYPHLRGIISPTTVGVAAAAQVVDSEHRAPQVQVTGLGTPNQMRQYIKDGTVQKFALWDPGEEGYISGYLAYDMATGKVTPQVGGTFDVANVGTRAFQNNNVVITGPPLVFTKDNIDNYHF